MGHPVYGNPKVAYSVQDGEWTVCFISNSEALGLGFTVYRIMRECLYMGYIEKIRASLKTASINAPRKPRKSGSLVARASFVKDLA